MADAVGQGEPGGVEGGDEGEGEDEGAGAVPPPAAELRRRQREERDGRVVFAAAEEELVAGPGGGGGDPEELGDVVDVVDSHAAVEGGGGGEIEGDEEGEDGEDAPRAGPDEAVCRVLTQPEENMDVLVLAPCGKEEQEVQVGGGLHLGLAILVICFHRRGGQKLQRPHKSIVQHKPRHRSNKHHCCLKLCCGVNFGFGWIWRVV